MSTQRAAGIRREYIEGLLVFSKGKLSLEDANKIADEHLRVTDFDDDSPLAHKGSDWAAWEYCRKKGLWVYEPSTN